MGTVYELTHRRLDRQFAAKVLAYDLSNDYTSLARFRREAEIVSGLRHPNIVDIVDWEHLDNGSPCIIMEYLHGESLADRLKRLRVLSFTDIVRIGQQMLSGLSVAHHEHIVHRDLKPDNVFLAQSTDAGHEVVKLLDFGISKIYNTQTLATEETALLGTPAYMSPEQAESRSADIDQTTDLWAMGAILYEMAAGRPAFDAQSVPSLLFKVCHRDPEPLATYRDDVPVAFEQVIARALARERERRFESAGEMSRALEYALGRSSRVRLVETPADLAANHHGLPVADQAQPFRHLVFDPQSDSGTDGVAPVERVPFGVASTMPGAALEASLDGQTTVSRVSGQTRTAHVGRSSKGRGVSLTLALVLLGVGLAIGLLVARGQWGDSAGADRAEERTRDVIPHQTPAGIAAPVRESATGDQDGSGEASASVNGDGASPTDVERLNDSRASTREMSDRTKRQQASKKRASKKRAGKKRAGKSRSRDNRDRLMRKTPAIERKKGEPVDPFATP